MIVSGTCMVITPFKPPTRPIVRDLIAYIWAVYWLFQCLYKGMREKTSKISVYFYKISDFLPQNLGKIELYDAIGFVCFYAIYVTGVIIGSKYFKPHQIDAAPEFDVPVVPAEPPIDHLVPTDNQTRMKRKLSRRVTGMSAISAMSTSHRAINLQFFCTNFFNWSW